MIPLTNPNEKSIKSIINKSFNPISQKIDNINSSLIKLDMRIHMSKVPIILEKRNYKQSYGAKPTGLWYGFGKEWLD